MPTPYAEYKIPGDANAAKQRRLRNTAKNLSQVWRIIRVDGTFRRAMPLHWTIDSKARLLTVLAEGDITRAEFEAYLDMLDQADLHGYRKLFDGSRGDTKMGTDNILAMGVRMRASHQIHAVGPLAIVVSEDKVAMVSRVLGMLAAARRPMRVFHEAGPAREWILKQPL